MTNIPIEITPYVKIISLIKMVGEFKERKNIQNIIYILKSKGLHFREQFSFKKNHPFSIELQMELDDLVENKVLRENGTINVNDDFNSYDWFTKIDNEIERNKELVNHITRITQDDLNIISTIFYLRNFDYSKEDLPKKIALLFPNLSGEYGTLVKVADEIANIPCN